MTIRGPIFTPFYQPDILVRTWTQTPSQTVPPVPINQYDWPLPTQPVRVEQTWIQFRIPPNVLPFNQKDWPNPTPPARIEQTWIETGNVGLPQGFPRNQYYWPLPSSPSRLDATWVEAGNNFPPLISVAIPFHQTDWPLPTPQPYAAWQYTWTEGYPTPGQIPPPVMGRNQYDWPVPTAYPRPDETYIWFRTPPATIPFNQYNWPLPGQPYRIDQTWFESGNNFPPLTLPNPFNQLDWPVPRGHPRPDATWTAFNLLTQRPTVTILPFNQYDWPNPKIPTPIDAYWVNQVPQLTPVPPVIIITAAGKWKDAVIEWKKDSDEKIKAAAAHMSSLGGHARAKALTSKHRSAIASKAASIRWKK